MTERLREKAGDSTLTLEDFLQDPDKYLKLMSDDQFKARYHLVDRQTYRMGTREEAEGARRRFSQFSPLQASRAKSTTRATWPIS